MWGCQSTISSKDVKKFLSVNRDGSYKVERCILTGKTASHVSCSVFKTAIGWCGMVMARRKIIRLCIGYTEPRLLIKDITDEFGGEVSMNHPRGGVVEKIKRYCLGENVSLTGVSMDWSPLTAFQQKVLRAAMRIPYGTVETYGSLARKIGVPKGSRAVGNALAKNPFPLLVPCHRIVREDGKMGGFSAGDGIGLKKMLLTMEGLQEEKKSAKREKAFY